MNTLPVDLSAPHKQPTDWKVLYGELEQFVAYFADRAKAEQFARQHHAHTIIPLAPV